MKIRLLISSAVLISVVACKASQKNMKDSMPLFNTKWSLKKIHTADSVENVNTKAFIRFDKEKVSAGGNGSCNAFGSTATITGNEIKFKNIFSTKMYCEEVQKTENSFFSQLNKVNRFEIKGKTLLLYQDKFLLLEFVADEQIKSTG